MKNNNRKMNTDMKNQLKTFSLCFFLLLFCHSSLVQAQSSPLIHFPVSAAFTGQDIVLEAKFENLNLQVTYVRIFYRMQGTEDYQYIEMDEETDRFVGAIPGAEVKSPAMEYFILALMSDQSVMTNPESNPFYSPHYVSVTEQVIEQKPVEKEIRSTGGAKITTLILSPEPGETIPPDEFVIAVSFISEEGTIDAKSVKLYLDEKDVTASTEVSEYIVSYTSLSISPGIHRVRLTASDGGGNPLDPLTWEFRVASTTEIRAVKKSSSGLRGRVYVDAKSEQITNEKLSTINSGANFSGKYGAVHYGGSFFLTSREDKEAQPRNRYLIEAGTSWIGMRFGDTNPRFNDLILWGKRVRGIEAYLKLGFLNFEFVQGETNRGIDGMRYNFQLAGADTIWTHPESGDTVQTIDGIYRYGTFKQTLTGLRTSLGSGRSFQLGINLLKVKDDVNSIQNGITPKDNLVVGPDLYMAFDNRRIEFRAAMAFSALTNDISSGPLTKAGIDTVFDIDLPIDPAEYEDYLILNASTIPLDPSNLTSLAYNAELKLNYMRNDLRVRYKSIGSEFNSLGNTFLRTNIEGYSVYDRIRLMQNQLYLTLGYDSYLDNLDDEDDENDFTEPTTLNTFTVGVSYYPRSRGLPKVSLNFKDHNRDNSLDTLNAVGNRTQDISVQLGYDIQLLNANHTLSVGIIGSDRVDDFMPQSSNIANDIRIFTLRSRFDSPLTTTLTFATNENTTGEDITEYTFKYNQYSFNADYLTMNNRLKLNSGVNMTSAIGSKPGVNGDEKYTDYQRIAFNVGCHFKITPKQYILLDGYIINFKEKLDSSSYMDNIYRARYEIKF